MPNECSVDGCERPHKARGYCSGHYKRWQEGRPINEPMGHSGCSVDGCDRPSRVRKYCNAHYRRWQKGRPISGPIRRVFHGPVKSRFPHLIDKSGNCWEWLGSRNPDGYGTISIDNRISYAHRIVYEMEVGAIPEDLELDHLCRNRACVNPEHLEPVTQRVNTLRGEGFAAINARKTHCIHGHPFDEKNTYITSAGHRLCRTCNRERARKRQAKCR